MEIINYWDNIRTEPQKIKVEDFEKNQKKEKKRRAENLERRKHKILCTIFFCAGLFAAVDVVVGSMYLYKSKKYKDYELVNAVALSEPVMQYRIRVLEGYKNLNTVQDLTAFGGNVIVDSYVPVDVNGDSVKDLNLHLVVKTKTKNISKKQKNALSNIKKGSSLFLEGVAERDKTGNIIDVKAPENGVFIDPETGRRIVDLERGEDYIDMNNLLMVDEIVLKNTNNPFNRKIFSTLKQKQK